MHVNDVFTPRILSCDTTALNNLSTCTFLLSPGLPPSSSSHSFAHSDIHKSAKLRHSQHTARYRCLPQKHWHTFTLFTASRLSFRGRTCCVGRVRLRRGRGLTDGGGDLLGVGHVLAHPESKGVVPAESPLITTRRRRSASAQRGRHGHGRSPLISRNRHTEQSAGGEAPSSGRACPEG